ncbi:hypothetical protein [Sporolactobacillus pectinivorans]|uniref:hypothetical protein n=1 Tax=Sporolactobacillus pectinivorans TaxID=1591408 RepID=UPI0012FDC878|nr:hypothetical protein [Sporolactobacillus pectinivorans]
MRITSLSFFRERSVAEGGNRFAVNSIKWLPTSSQKDGTVHKALLVGGLFCFA